VVVVVILTTKTTNFKKNGMGWGWSSGVGHVLSMHEALGLIPNTKKKKKNSGFIQFPKFQETVSNQCDPGRIALGWESRAGMESLVTSQLCDLGQV
jgi:hypothetical protein